MWFILVSSCYGPPIYLDAWSEASGLLIGIDHSSGVLHFEGFNVKVPVVELEKSVINDSLIGENIAILRTDIPETPLLLGRFNSTPETR